MKINQHKRVYEVGEAKAVGDLVFINSSNLNLRNIREELNLEMVLELQQMLRSPIEKKRKVSRRDQSDDVPIGLPLGKNWAQACSAPFKKYKQKMYEGSMASPFIIAGKGIPSSNVVRNEFFSIQDIAPTFLEMAGTSYPSEWEGKQIEPQRGVSALAYLQQKADKVHENDYIFAMEHRRTAFLRKGNWKITNQVDAASNELFELYNLGNDFSEQGGHSTSTQRRRHLQAATECLNGGPGQDSGKGDLPFP